MIKEIIYEGEILFVEEDQLAGYSGCKVIATHDEKPPQDIYLLASREHLASVHLQKALEASLILSGYTLVEGLLAAEAKELGIDLQELALRVKDKRTKEVEFEVARRAAKTK